MLGFDKTEDFLAAIGYGDINTQQIASKVLQSERGRAEKEALEPLSQPRRRTGDQHD